MFIHDDALSFLSRSLAAFKSIAGVFWDFLMTPCRNTICPANGGEQDADDARLNVARTSQRSGSIFRTSGMPSG